MIFGAARSAFSRQPRSARRDGASEPLPPKLIPSLRLLFSTAGSVLHTRLALAGIELEEEVQRFLNAAVFGVVALVFVLLALIVGTFTIVFAVAPEYRIATMVGITVVYFAIAAFGVMRVKNVFASRPPIFAGTLAEIEKDRDTLAQITRVHREAEEARERQELARRQEEEARETEARARADLERAARRAARGAR